MRYSNMHNYAAVYSVVEVYSCVYFQLEANSAFFCMPLATVHIQVHQYIIKDVLKLRLTKQTPESKIILCVLLWVYTLAVVICCYSILNNNFLRSHTMHFLFKLWSPRKQDTKYIIFIHKSFLTKVLIIIKSKQPYQLW